MRPAEQSLKACQSSGAVDGRSCDFHAVAWSKEQRRRYYASTAQKYRVSAAS